MPGQTVKGYDNIGGASGAKRYEVVQFNNGITDLQTLALALSIESVWLWSTGGNSTVNPLTRGSTDTRVGFGGFTVGIKGVATAVAGSAGGTAFGALGTIPASTWGIIALNNDGTTMTFQSGAANYTTGYATEAAAIAALPARLTAVARVGYVTILASASTFVVGTDALAGGASGNPATTTNYYPSFGLVSPTGTNYTTTYGFGAQFAGGGANSPMIGSTLSIGGTDTNVKTTAFTYNANGICNVNKAVVTAGTAFGLTGTIPASKWGLFVMWIDAAGTITFTGAPLNFTTGYSTASAALNDWQVTQVPANKCQVGAVVVQASSSTWVCGTDALAGGASGNPASNTTYISNPGVTLASGLNAAQIGNMTGTPISTVTW